MTMSEKDKNTLIIAIVALLIFGIAFLGIKPAFTSLKETKAINAELSATKETMQTEINALPTYKTDLETAKSEYSSTAVRVYGDLTTDKVHDEVVKMVQDLGLEITDFTVSILGPNSVKAYTISEGEAAGGLTEGTVNIANVSVGVFGAEAQIINFVDYLNKTEGLLLQNVSIVSDGEKNAVTIPFYMVLADSVN